MKAVENKTEAKRCHLCHEFAKFIINTKDTGSRPYCTDHYIDLMNSGNALKNGPIKFNPLKDKVNSPDHYTSSPSGIEVIEITRHLNFNLGNAIKYIMRANKKGTEAEDLNKAIWYLLDELQRLKLEVTVKIEPHKGL